MKSLFLVLALISFVSCGVKGPPLPPVADNPAASEREDVVAKPSPTPSPSVSTKVKKTSKKKSQ